MISFRHSTRLVIILHHIVIKIPISRRGYLQGLNEKRLWDKYGRDGFLAELKWVFMGIVCQKRYVTVESIPSLVVRRVKSKVPEFNFDNCDLRNPQNWGIEGKTYILLDYGINKHIASLY